MSLKDIFIVSGRMWANASWLTTQWNHIPETDILSASHKHSHQPLLWLFIEHTEYNNGICFQAANNFPWAFEAIFDFFLFLVYFKMLMSQILWVIIYFLTVIFLCHSTSFKILFLHKQKLQYCFKVVWTVNLLLKLYSSHHIAFFQRKRPWDDLTIYIPDFFYFSLFISVCLNIIFSSSI